MRAALIGLFVWVLFAFLSLSKNLPLKEVSLVELLFLFCPFVLVPLAVPFAKVDSPRGNKVWFWSGVTYFVGCFALLLSLMAEPGLGAGLLASLWLFFTVLVAMYGLMRFLARIKQRLEEICMDVGMLFLTLSSLWFVSYRLDTMLLGQSGTSALLLSSHLMYAGFVTCFILGLTGRVCRILLIGLPSAYLLSVTLVITGVCLFLLEKVVIDSLEGISPWVIGLGLFSLAILLLRLGIFYQKRLSFTLLFFISGFSAILSATFSLASVRALIPQSVVSYEQTMLVSHGAISVFGFSLCALLAFAKISPAAVKDKQEDYYYYS